MGRIGRIGQIVFPRLRGDGSEKHGACGATLGFETEPRWDSEAEVNRLATDKDPARLPDITHRLKAVA